MRPQTPARQDLARPSPRSAGRQEFRPHCRDDITEAQRVKRVAEDCTAEVCMQVTWLRSHTHTPQPASAPFWEAAVNMWWQAQAWHGAPHPALSGPRTPEWCCWGFFCFYGGGGLGSFVLTFTIFSSFSLTLGARRLAPCPHTPPPHLSLPLPSQPSPLNITTVRDPALVSVQGPGPLRPDSRGPRHTWALDTGIAARLSDAGTRRVRARLRLPWQKTSTHG